MKFDDLLITLCFFAGNAASCPEIHATLEEAAKVGDAYREFAKFHSIAITEKRMSEINMIIAAGSFGIPRIVAFYRSQVKPRPRLAPTPIRDAAAAPDAPKQEPGPYSPLDGIKSAMVPGPEPVDLDFINE